MDKINFETTKSKLKIVKNNRGSQRGFILEKFLLKLNSDRREKGYKPLTYPRLSKMIAHMSTDDLYAFYKQCEDVDMPFSAFFFWSLKVKK